MTTEMVFGLLGGLGLFLFGMRVMGDGLRKSAGDRLRRLLEILTTRAIMGVIVGAVVTAVIQSSSATTVMTVGFVNAGLMSLRQAVGIIMGANIGTTITAQLIAFELEEYALPAIGIGVALHLFGKRKTYKYLGEILLGFGILFLGMETMKEAMKPLRTMPWFTHLMVSLGQNKVLGVLAGFGLTGIVQSSSATIGILQALASQGLVDLRTALPILFGDNIGTTVTAMLSSIGASVAARRAALVHFLFNVLGTILFMAMLPVVTPVVMAASSEVVRQIANAHTLFNVTNTLVQLPFVGFLVLIVTRLIPGEAVELEHGPKYLDKRILNTPSIALGNVKKELQRMGMLARETLHDAIQGFFEKDPKALERAYEKEKVVNELERAIVDYLVQLSRAPLTDKESEELNGMLNIVNDIERVGDHAENIAELAENKIDRRLPFSPRAIDDLDHIYGKVMGMIEDAVEGMWKNDTRLARKVVKMEDEVDMLEKELRRAHIQRLNEGACYPGSGVVYLDIISNLERIADHCSSIGHIILGNGTEGGKTR